MHPVAVSSGVPAVQAAIRALARTPGYGMGVFGASLLYLHDSSGAKSSRRGKESVMEMDKDGVDDIIFGTIHSFGSYRLMDWRAMIGKVPDLCN